MRLPLEHLALPLLSNVIYFKKKKDLTKEKEIDNQ